jgi:hypothetical protein
MTDVKSGRGFFGYVSSYLTMPRRSLAEAERDREAQQRLDEEARRLVDDARAVRRTKTEPRS